MKKYQIIYADPPKCRVCGKNHATWEHRIYEKIKLAEIGVPIERLFIIIPDELESGDEKIPSDIS